jgi:replicative DNA helicase
MKDAPGVTFGIPSVDSVMVPMHPGDLTVLVARPGHGKTSLLAYLARHEAERIMREGKNLTGGECVVYISLEQITEEIDSYFQMNDVYSASDIVWGRVDMDVVKANAIRRVALPIWLIGDSIAKASPDTPRMTTDVIWQLVQSIRWEYDITPTLICLDYLQLIPVRKASDIVTDVTYAAGMIKELAKQCGCPAIVAVQARQEVDDYNVKLARLRDGQWASRIGQTCDKWFSLWRPWITDRGIAPIEINGDNIEISENLFVMQMLKQRFGAANFTFPLYFDIPQLKLCKMELERKPLEEQAF